MYRGIRWRAWNAMELRYWFARLSACSHEASQSHKSDPEASRLYRKWHVRKFLSSVVIHLGGESLVARTYGGDRALWHTTNGDNRRIFGWPSQGDAWIIVNWLAVCCSHSEKGSSWCCQEGARAGVFKMFAMMQRLPFCHSNFFLPELQDLEGNLSASLDERCNTTNKMFVKRSQERETVNSV